MYRAQNLLVRGSKRLVKTFTSTASQNTNPFIFGGNLVLLGTGSLCADEVLADLGEKEAK